MTDKNCDKVSVWGGLGEKKSNSGTQFYQQHRVYDSRCLCPSLSVYMADYWIVVFDDDYDDDMDQVEE